MLFFQYPPPKHSQLKVIGQGFYSVVTITTRLDFFLLTAGGLLPTHETNRKQTIVDVMSFQSRKIYIPNIQHSDP